jgi:hypothetical protein
MFLANKNPEADLAVIEDAAENIAKIAPKVLVLISSVAVIDDPIGTDERHEIDVRRLTPYGRNRYVLEVLAQERVDDCHIIRLPALFGENLRKNFIHDIINPLPSLLSEAKFKDLSNRERIIKDSYSLQSDGFFKLDPSASKDKELVAAFRRTGFSALNFTDSRSVFQFYNLANLWRHIELALANDVALLHLVTEPIVACEVFQRVVGGEFENHSSDPPYHYDCRTCYSRSFGRSDGYIAGKDEVLDEIVTFVKGRP